MNGAAGDYEYDNDVPINSQPNMVISGNSPSLNYKYKLIIINLVFWLFFILNYICYMFNYTVYLLLIKKFPLLLSILSPFKDS